MLLESWGAPAACAVFYLIGRLWFALQRRGAQNGWMLPLQMAFDTLLIMSLVDGVFYHARLVMLGALVVATSLRATQAHRRSSASVAEHHVPQAAITTPLTLA